MPNWKKLIVSGSDANLNSLEVTHNISAFSVTASVFKGDGSQLTNINSASYASTASLTTTVEGGKLRYIPLWSGSNILSASYIYQMDKGIFIGKEVNPHVHSAEGETLAVHSGETGVKNVIYAHGTFNDDYRINLRNVSSGSSASANYKATSDVGNDLGGYVQMGINSSTYARADQIGGPLDAYLYTTGSDLLIGTLSPDKNIILFTGPGNASNNARVYIDASGSVGINSSTPTGGNPEALIVEALTNSYNLITAKATLDNYTQINIKNLSGGNSASADIVATNNIGNETSYYIDMGINSDQYNQPGLVGGPNDAYIYSTGNMLHIGNASENQHVMIFAGGLDAEANNKLTLDANNNHSLSGSLNVTGSVNVLNGVVNNLTASFAVTASYVEGAASDWNTLSNKPDGIVSSSTQVQNYNVFATTGSNVFKASQTITGSLIVTDTITAQQFNIELISSSVIYESGSTKFGDSADDTHQFTGSLSVLGTISGSLVLPNGVVSSSTQAANWTVLSASFATTASTATSITFTPSTASFSTTASFSITSSAATSITFMPSTASFANTASAATSITFIPSTSSFSTTASAATSITFTPLTASFSTTSSAATSITFTPSTASFATSASYAPTILPNGIFSSSLQVDYTQIQNKPTTIETASYVEFSNVANKPTLVSSSLQINTGSFSGSITTASYAETSSFAVTASYAVNVNLPPNIISSSTQFNLLSDTSASFAVTSSFSTTSSFATSASYAPTILPGGIFSSSLQVDYTQIQNKPTTIETASYVEFSNVANKPALISSSNQFTNINAPFTGSFTGSFVGLVTASNFEGYAVVAHRYLELYPTDVNVAGDADPNSAYFYISGSGNDLWYTHKTDSTVNFDWIEGVLETGLIHGGIGGFNGSDVYIRSGSGIIVNHGANTGSASSPTVTYVQWPVITGSIDVTQGFVTYLAINANGILESSSTKFTSLDYHDKIPLGAVGHFNQQAIAAKGEQINTQYSQTAQLTDFARNFGPIKVGGYGISAQSGSLKFTRAAGNAFIYGGFYSQNPETPSNFQSSAASTGSLAYIYRSGSGYTIDANNNNFYTDLKPGWYDDGGLTTASLASNEWSIQRVFIEPVTGIHYIYFGQAKYTSLANAVSNILTDPFAEGPATTLFTVFVGYIIMKGDTTNLADTTSNDIISAGLFRNTSAGSVGGGAAAQLLNDLSDVNITTPSNGQALIYSSGNWINGTPANATNATFAITASAADSITFIPSSASFATSASFSTTSATASFYSLQNSGIVSSSTQIPELLPSGSVSSSAFGSPSQGTVRTIINGITVDVDTGLQTGDSVSFTGLTLTGLTDTTATNKILVLNTATNQLFTTTSNSALSASFAESSSFSTTASFATTSSFAVSASWAPVGTGGLTTKAGSVTNTSFAGNPRKATVTFATAFPNTSYAVTVTGEDARTWTIESKLAGSFVINTNSNTALAGTTYWIATAYGET